MQKNGFLTLSERIRLRSINARFAQQRILSSKNKPIKFRKEQTVPAIIEKQLDIHDIELIMDLTSKHKISVDPNIVRRCCLGKQETEDDSCLSLKSNIGRVTRGGGFIFFNRQDQILGFVLYCNTYNGIQQEGNRNVQSSCTFEIYSMFVNPDFKNIGFERKLFYLSVHEAKKRQFNKIIISLDEFNQVLWKNLGFTQMLNKNVLYKTF